MSPVRRACAHRPVGPVLRDFGDQSFRGRQVTRPDRRARRTWQVAGRVERRPSGRPSPSAPAAPAKSHARNLRNAFGAFVVRDFLDVGSVDEHLRRVRRTGHRRARRAGVAPGRCHAGASVRSLGAKSSASNSSPMAIAQSSSPRSRRDLERIPGRGREERRGSRSAERGRSPRARARTPDAGRGSCGCRPCSGEPAPRSS